MELGANGYMKIFSRTEFDEDIFDVPVRLTRFLVCHVRAPKTENDL